MTTLHRPSGALPRRVWLALALLATATAARAKVAPDTPAPDFTLRQIDGPNLRLGEQRGRVVLVNFWATWCGPCRVELPHLSRLADKYRSAGLLLLGVNIDEDPAQAKALAARLGLRFPVLLDTERKVVAAYDLAAMPATVLIDKDGRARHLHRGYRDGVEALYEQQVRNLLKE